MNAKETKPEDKLIDLMTQYLHAYGPRLLGDVVMKSLVKYSEEDGQPANKIMLFSHVCYGMAGEVYEQGIKD